MFGIWAGAQNGGLDYPIPHHRTCPSAQYPPPPHPSFFSRPPIPKEGLSDAHVSISKQGFSIIFDTRGFSPDELEIKSLDGFLSIEGETFLNSGEDGVKTFRKFKRRILLPENCNEDKIICELGGPSNADTVLRITIPRDVTHEKRHYITLSDHNKRCHHSAPSYFTPSHYDHGLNPGHPAMSDYFSESGVKAGKHNFVVKLDLPQFSGDEIEVKTVDDFLVVEGNQGDKEDKNCCGVFSSFSFKRRYLLPLNADMDGISCALNDEGKLQITVPRINVGKTEGEQVHKIERK